MKEVLKDTLDVLKDILIDISGPLIGFALIILTMVIFDGNTNIYVRVVGVIIALCLVAAFFFAVKLKDLKDRKKGSSGSGGADSYSSSRRSNRSDSSDYYDSDGGDSGGGDGGGDCD